MSKTLNKKLEKYITVLLIMGLFLLFGSKNLIVAFGTIIIAVPFYREDYTSKPLLFINKMVFIQVSLGIAAYVANLNIYLNIIISFIVVFSLCYGFSYDFKPAKSSGFVMMYLFLLYSNVPLEEMPKRLLALAFSGLVIIAQYYYFTNHNFEKKINLEIKKIAEAIKKELESILEGEDKDNSNINILIKNAEVEVHDRLENSKKDTEKSIEKSIVLFTLSNLKRNIKKVKRTDQNEFIIREIILFVDQIILYSIGELTLLDIKNDILKSHILTKDIKETKGIDKYRFYNILLTVKEFIKAIDNKENYINLYNDDRVKRLKINRKKVANKSIRYNLALKTSILLSISIFLVDYCGVYVGKWLPFTISVLVLPFVEEINKKIKDRVFGTVIGVISFEILYLIGRENKIVLWIAFAVCLFFTFTTKEYKRRAIFITIMSLSMVVLLLPSSQSDKVGIYRLALNFLAIIIVALVTNNIFPFSVKDDTIRAIEEIIENNKEVLKAVLNNSKEVKNIDNLTLMSNHYYRRLSYNNLLIKSENLNILLSYETEFLSDVKVIYKNNKQMKAFDIYYKNVSIIEKNFKGDDILEKIRELFYKADNDKERLIIISIFRLYRDFNCINETALKIKEELK